MTGLAKYLSTTYQCMWRSSRRAGRSRRRAARWVMLDLVAGMSGWLRRHYAPRRAVALLDAAVCWISPPNRVEAR